MDQIIHRKIDENMQLGYQVQSGGKLQGAGWNWHQVWAAVAGLMADGNYQTIEDLDADFHGRQSIDNWANDFVQALLQPRLDQTPRWQEIVDFCRQYLAWSGKPSSLNNRNRRRLLGEGLFALGRPEEGDKVFSDYLSRYPEWGWGWISWAKQYSWLEEAPGKSLAKAESILRQGLKSEKLESRALVLEKLRAVLQRQGRAIEASNLQ